MEKGKIEDGRWGTWEELLLACAVNRHGTKRWESVAMEIQSRSSSARILTAQICRQKYHELQRKFISENKKVGDKSEGEERDEIPWLEELRRLRVSELKREVQRYDVSIASLQLKVNKLKRERQQGLKEHEIAEEKRDLGINGEENEKVGEAGKSSPGDVTGTHISDEESDRETESFNESNSMDPRGENREIEDKKPSESFTKLETEAETAAGKPDLIFGDPKDEKVVEEVKLAGKNSGELPEFQESVAQSKESSDVQSSASLLKKNRRKRTSSGEEAEIDEGCPVSSVKSQPLMDLLDMIRSHKYAYIFERRLPDQESIEYGRIIREHVDLETVKSKLEEGLYDSSSIEFFRDLLLLFNNAIVFYPKNSTESDAAVEIRELLSKEILTSIKPPPPPEDPKPLPEPSNSAGLVIFCRRRTSVSAKPSKTRETDAKPNLELNNVNINNPLKSVNASRIAKKKRKERSVSGLRSSDNRNKYKDPNPKPNPTRNQNPSHGSESDKIGSTSNSKKGSVANFLSRMKRSSNGVVVSEANSGNKKGEVAGKQALEQKKEGRGRDGPKDHGYGRKQAAPAETRSTPAKRSIGRPPKKVPPMPKEAVPASRPPRKRSKR